MIGALSFKKKIIFYHVLVVVVTFYCLVYVSSDIFLSQISLKVCLSTKNAFRNTILNEG